VRSRSTSLTCVVAFAIGALGGCQPVEEAVEEAESTESNVQLAPTVVVADAPSSNAAEVLPDSLKIPDAVGKRYASLAAGTVFVGARAMSARGSAKEDNKNPDGFLRRIDSIRHENGAVVIMTKPATLTDAVLNGAVRTSSTGGGSIDGNELRAGKDFKIELDFGSSTLFENVDEIETALGKTRFTESIKIETGRLFAQPAVDIDLTIRGGKVGRFMSRVQGELDTSIKARAEVKAAGPVSAETARLLRERPHEISKVVYQSDRIPLPTFSVGEIPVSPAVEFTVTMRCKLEFSGPLVATAGVDAKSYVRLAAVQTNGEWAPPAQSDFEIKPSFVLERSSEVAAHCALETDAKLSAYGATGLTMTVAPYVDFNVGSARIMIDDGSKLRQGVPLWTASAGATGSMKGSGDVFGLLAAKLDQPLVEWKAPKALQGAAP
jgi:hypothetical protein